MIRIFIADDHEMTRATIRQLIEQADPTWKVCGEAADGNEAIRKATELNPDLIILDIAMPVLDGLGASRVMRAKLREVPILIYTFMDFANLDEMVKEAGAQGVLRKGDRRALITGIRELLSSKQPLSRDAAPENKSRNRPVERET